MSLDLRAWRQAAWAPLIWKGRRYCLTETMTSCQERENLLISVCLCSVVYSTQHRSVWKYRRRWSPAGLPVPDPGSLFSRQRLLALGMAIHNDCKEPFWAFTDPLTLLMAGSNLVQCFWKAARDFNQHCLCWDGNFLLWCLSSCKYIRF